MPETACLHIQARESDPVRVVDLRAGPVRIGRAAFCDVRLADPELADEECRLRRRGGSWQIVPVAGRGSVRLDGRALDGPSALGFGMTFLVGAHALTLRPAATSTPWPDRAPATADPVAAAAVPGREMAPADRPEWSSEDDSHERRVHARRETKRWESRWRAAGEKLRAASAAVSAPASAPPVVTVTMPARPEAPTVEARVVPRAEPPAAAESLRKASLLRESVARRPDVRPTTPSSVKLPTAQAPPAVPVPGRQSAEARTSEYVPPAAPNSRREPVRSSAWSDSQAPLRPVPADPVRVRRAEPSAEARRREPSARKVELRPPSVSTELTVTVQPPRATVEEAEVSAPAPPAPDRMASPVEAAPIVPEVTQTHDEAGVPRGEHVDLSNVEFEALLSRLQTQILDDVPPATVDVLGSAGQDEVPNREPVIGEGFLRVLEDPPAPGLILPEPIDDDEDREAEPETSRPVLGATRRGVRVSRPEPRPEQAATGQESVRAVATPHAPEPSSDDRAPRDWCYQTPFVTDTNHVPRGDETRMTPDRAAYGRDEIAAAGREPLAAISARQWPSVSDILAAQGARSSRRPAAAAIKKGRGRRPEPTASREPGQWRLPLWLAWLPGSAAAVAVGAVGLTGAWAWAVDGYNAGVVAQRLAGVDPSKTPLPAGVVPSAGSWWTTSATHLVQWAAYLDRDGDGPSRAAEARALLARAAGVAPLNASVRYALARPSAGEQVAPGLALARSLGQSRDVLSLAWAGRTLLAAGKKESALRAYRAGLEMAARADVARGGVPAFLDDPQARRYALPTEDLLGPVIREMAGATAWSFKDWVGALPRGTAAAVVAARVLRESGSPDAAAALDSALADGSSAPPPASTSTSSAGEAIRLAAWAEALAMAQRWADARDRYRQAVDLMPVDTVRRAWWFNLADLASHLDEDADRQNALEAAKVADMKDEITRRVVDLQRASGTFARRPGGRVAGSAVADAEARR